MTGRTPWLICWALLLTAAGAQAAALEGGVAPAPGPDDGERPELALAARVDNRLAAYGEKLAHWRELGERTANPALAARRPGEWLGCYATVENLARSYGRLKEELGRRSEPPGREFAPEIAVWQVFSDDVAFLEGGCGQVFQQFSGLVGSGDSRGVVPSPSAAGPQRPPLGEQEQLEKWNRAVGLFDSGNYDEAIAEFSCLMNTPHATAAREKIREAQTVVATQLRRQAAGILARKTDDVAQKKRLLTEAWALLNKIVGSYPEAAIIDKVKQNQAQVEGQLDQLDPALLPRLKGGGPTS